MSVGIECPVCEAIFAVKQVNPKTGIRCPECNRKFRYSHEIQTTKKSVEKAEDLAAKTADKTRFHSKPAVANSESAVNNTSASNSEAGLDQQARLNKTSKWKTAATEAPRLQTPKPVLTEELKESEPAKEQPKDESKSDEVESILDRKKRKARRQSTYTTVTIAILLIVTAILGFAIYRQVNLPADQLVRDRGSAETNQTPVNTTPQNPSPVDPQPIEPDDLPAAESGDPDEDENPIEPPRVLADDLPEREFDFFLKKELRSVWQRVRPRLVSLAVRTDEGVKQSVGTIVDSRGWVLTSNQWVGKWPDVSATASARDIDAYYADVDARKQGNDENADQDADKPVRQTLLTDVSKGIASTQPKRDQTLLALNTRFVVALDKFEFAPRTNIVAGLFLVQAAPPSPTNPYGFEELEVFGRQEFEELETEALSKAEALGIDDPLATWVVTSKKADPAVGTPAFTRTGQMVGTFAFSTKQFAYFVLSDQASNLIAQATQSGAEKGKLQQVDADAELISPSHDMARTSELLNRAGSACEAFGWIATDAGQYTQLQKFSRRFSTIAKYIQDNQDDESDSVTLSILSDQTKRWQRSLSTSIRDVFKLDPKKVTKLNAIAIDKLNAQRPNTANTYIPFVAEFYTRGFDENNEEAILLTLNEDESVIKVGFTGRIRGMLPGSLWLCFYKRPAQLERSLIGLNSGHATPMYDGGNILKVLGPIEKR